MKFVFHSIQEIREFINFVNEDKDQIIKGETNALNKESEKLKAAVGQQLTLDKKA